MTRRIRFGRSLERIDTQKPIRCVFFALFDSVWKCDSLFRTMLEDEHFDPIILICPIVNYGRTDMLKRMEDCACFFESKGYNYIKAYDENSDKYIDVMSDLEPDIIFYTNPYKGLIDSRYYIDKFPKTLTCYIPYFYASGNDNTFFDLNFHHLLWRFYIENEQLKLEYQDRSQKYFDNLNPVGYCVFDDFKVTNSPKNYKTIIWAPHHVINNDSKYIRNSFFKYHDVFFYLAAVYKGEVKFIFRPHPLLKNKLYEHSEWGIDKTDAYYMRWRTTENCELNEKGDYVDLFDKSDAMIHDCGSFLTEYIYYNKPGLYTVLEDFSQDKYWSCAIEAKQCYYVGDTLSDIESFISEIVLGENDYRKKTREKFILKYFDPYNNVAQSVLYDIYTSIKNKRIFID